MPQFFIDRPVFAWVIAILISIGGLLAILALPVESYPTVAPPQVQIQANYPGANAETVERSVTQVIEQQLKSIDGLLYFTSSAGSTGSANVTLTFAGGTDIDTAVVQTQARVAQAEPRLPTDVVQQGITVQKAAAGFLMVVGLRSTDGRYTRPQLSDIASTYLVDEIQRLPGVGSVNIFGAELGMRVWLNPQKLHAFGIAPSTVLDMVRRQNVQFASGSIGTEPSVSGQQFQASVAAEGRFSSAEEFQNIILRADPNGTTVRLRDVARVEIGPSNYSTDGFDGDFTFSGLNIQTVPGANALEVADAAKAKLRELESTFPPSVEWYLVTDTTEFINVAIREVVYTLLEAIALVFLVMLIFLQSFRATFIPLLVVPVALLGALTGLYMVGYSINQLTLFAMVLAIGIVVDDAIVVIEAVDRLMRDEHLDPREATRKAMRQITAPIIAITVVLSAVFLPAALQPGTVGGIYRQFALTIGMSTLVSAFLAMTFTPALCAAMLRPTHLKANAVFRGFNRAYESSQAAYLRRVAVALRHTPRWMAGFAVLVALGIFLFLRLPGSFIPQEDQGLIIASVELPPGATLARTMGVMKRVESELHKNDAIASAAMIGGFSFFGQGENVGLAFVRLKHWDDRDVSVQELLQWANGTIAPKIPDARLFFLSVPPIAGFGATSGFDFYLEDRSGVGRQALADASRTLLDATRDSAVVTRVRQNTVQPAPRLHLTIDRVQAQSMGVAVNDVYTAIQLMLAPVYANDFFYQGRVRRVFLQADAPYRMSTEAFDHIYLPSTLPASQTGGADNRGVDTITAGDMRMVPLSSVVRTNWEVVAPTLTRYNGYPAVQINGEAAPGVSTGEAIEEMERLVQEKLPTGFGFDWAGQSLQEIISGNQAPLLFALSLLVVFLCLAALYESWSTPVAVMLVVPVGILGALLAVTIRDMPNDVFFKVGLLAIIGLSAKNAILIVEFAVKEQAAGKSLYAAVLEAARLRLRAILMTSFAFILGVLPLALSTGAGANARRAIGTGVVGGMLTATIIGVLLVPTFYVIVRRLRREPLDAPAEPGRESSASAAPV
jgi:multidrug efflux pump